MTAELQSSRIARVLLVEDSEDDVILTRAAFRRAKLAIDMRHVENGRDCLDFLRKRGRYADAPTPDLILLDLNLPVMDGREVLRELVADESLRHLPVVVLTTSAGEQEILEMYRLRCSSYIVKPVDVEQFQRIVRELSEYWFTVVILPDAS